jgi:hypothetical protein
MKSPPPTSAKPERSLAEEYAEAQADFAKWSMLAAAPIRAPNGTAGSGLSPEASVFANKVARGYAKIVDALEKALMKQNGNQLPEELQARLTQISKAAASRGSKRLSWSRVFRAIGLRLRR